MIKTLLPRLLFFKKSSTNYTQLPLDDRWRSLLHGTTSKKQLARHLLPLHLLTKAPSRAPFLLQDPRPYVFPPLSPHFTIRGSIPGPTTTYTHPLSLLFSSHHPSIHRISCLRTFPALKAQVKAKAKEKEKAKFHRVIDVIK